VLGWLLAGIAQHETLSQTWVFKGGTCLRTWLAGRSGTTQLPRAQPRNVGVDPTWEAPKAITSWRRGVALELLRYAGANRLKVDLDYRPEQGRQGPRRVEPYSLRRSRDGSLLLFVVNDQGQLRSYRVTASPGSGRARSPSPRASALSSDA